MWIVFFECFGLRQNVDKDRWHQWREFPRLCCQQLCEFYIYNWNEQRHSSLMHIFIINSLQKAFCGTTSWPCLRVMMEYTVKNGITFLLCLKVVTGYDYGTARFRTTSHLISDWVLLRVKYKRWLFLFSTIMADDDVNFYTPSYFQKLN